MAMMDLLACAGIAVLEAMVLDVSGQDDTASANKLPLFLWLAGLQYAALKVYRFWIYPAFLSPLRHLPGPKDNFFLLGQWLNILKANGQTEVYVSWMRRWPDAPFIRYLSFGNQEMLLVNSLNAHKEVHQTKCYSFQKPAFFKQMVEPITGKGLLLLDGDEHRKQRRLLNGPFSAVNLKKLIPVIKAKSQGMKKLLDEALEHDGTLVNVTEVFTKTTLDVIGVAALGVELNNLSGTDSFYSNYDRILNQSILGQVILALHAFFPIRWMLPIEANRRFTSAAAEIRVILRGLIRERRRAIASGEFKKGAVGKASRDYLTFMIEEGHTGDDAWTDEAILEHLLTIFVAGHETTANFLTWATYMMAKHHDIQDHIRNEILAFLDKTPDWDGSDLEALPYLNNFFRETLRLYTPVIMINRQANTDVVIDGVHIPKGTNLFLSPAVAHFNPIIWGSDADVFDPDRWNRLEGQSSSPYAFEAFINGPRICIGKAFASLEAKTLLVELVSNYKFVSGPDKLVIDRGLTYKPKEDMTLKVERLNR